MLLHTLSKLVRIAVCILLAHSANAQQHKITYLDSLSAKHTYTTICGKNHYHPVDRKAKLIIDSLKQTGIDTLLIYRHWLGTNGFNGYGKVLWLDKGVLKQYRINFTNYNYAYGIKSIQYAVPKTDSIFSFFFKNKIDTITTNPEKQEIWMSHDADHFVYFEAGGKTHCFNIAGLLIRYNPAHLRSQFVTKLMIDVNKYVEDEYGGK